MCMTDDADISPQPEHLAPGHEPVPPASDVVPEPERLGKTWQCIPDEVLLPPDSVEESDFSWTTKASSSVSSVLPSDSPISVPQSRHAYAPRDLSPYTSEPLPVGGRPVQPTKPLKQSILTAKDRLKKLSKLEFSVLSTLLNVPKAQGGPQDKESQAQSEVASAETSFDEGTSVDEDDASSRAMGSLEWLNLCSGPPKAISTTICPASLSVSCALRLPPKAPPIPAVAGQRLLAYLLASPAHLMHACMDALGLIVCTLLHSVQAETSVTVVNVLHIQHMLKCI